MFRAKPPRHHTPATKGERNLLASARHVERFMQAEAECAGKIAVLIEGA